MKYLTLILAVAATLESTALAGPLQRTDVAADAKWLVHLDFDQLRSTSQGAYVMTNIADSAFAKAKTVLKNDTGFDLDLTKIRSLTAYGNWDTRHTNGVLVVNSVLLVKTDLSMDDLEKVMDGILARIKREGIIVSPPVGKSVQDGMSIYTLRDHVVLAVRPDGTTIVSKSADEVSRANDVLSGKAPNLSSGSTFTEFPDSQNAFFFFGGIDGFNALHHDAQSHEGAGNNPKANILKMADSGRIILGQNADQVFLDVAVKAKTSEVVKQMQQAIQGLIALASLEQPDNPDVQRLAESAKVSTNGQIVSLDLDFPVDKTVSLLQSNVVHLMEHEREREQRRATNSPGTTNGK